MSGWRKARRRIGASVERVLDLALPATCAGCEREGEPVCGACRPALHVRREAQPGVALGLVADIPAPLVQLEWCAPFSGITRAALHRLKYAGERRLAVPLGDAIAGRWRIAAAGGDVLVPVPASPDRVRDRGYDHAQLLAARAAAVLGVPLVSALARARRTAAQFDLDRAGRGANVAGAFVVEPELVPALRGAWVVLVDDVVTTGSTLAACGEALLEAGVLGVSAVTVARER